VVEVPIVDEPGYPKYVVTGDQDKDEEQYANSKAKWVQENPEKYNKLAFPNGGSPDATASERERESQRLNSIKQ
jgi:hypothetical protein